MSAEEQLLAEIVKQREAVGLSIPKFAKLLGVSERAIRSLDRGERVPGVKVLGTLVVAFPELKPAVMAYLEERGNEALGEFGARLESFREVMPDVV